MEKSAKRLRFSPWLGGLGCLLLGLAALSGHAEPPAAVAEPLPGILTRAGAVSWALQNNPELAALRQQRGIAAAGVVIARTYPFNPVLESRVQANNGPESAGITNRVALEQILLWEIELRGQGTFRRQSACAALKRTEWEIAFQELKFAVGALRTFDTYIYRQEKLRLLQDTIDLNHRIVEQLDALRKAGRPLAPADFIVARTEEDDARAALGTGRTNLAVAGSDLRRALGLVDGKLELDGTLQPPVHPWDAETLIPAALDRRQDLRARQVAVSEAQARLQLEIAQRYGNFVGGPAYTYDPTRINLIGGQVNIPLPIFNTHRGDIQQREAEVGRAILELRQTDVTVRQDVLAALERLNNARAWAATYQNETLRRLEQALKEMQTLLEQGQPDMVLRLVDIRRKLIRARDSYLDALWEVSQAKADLAAAVGDPALGMTP